MKTCEKCNVRKPIKDFIHPTHVYCFQCFGSIHKKQNNTNNEKDKKHFEIAKVARNFCVNSLEKSIEKLENRECKWTEVWAMMIWLDSIDYQIYYDRTYSEAQLYEILS